MTHSIVYLCLLVEEAECPHCFCRPGFMSLSSLRYIVRVAFSSYPEDILKLYFPLKTSVKHGSTH